jgi:hypothetical protein
VRRALAYFVPPGLLLALLAWGRSTRARAPEHDPVPCNCINLMPIQDPSEHRKMGGRLKVRAGAEGPRSAEDGAAYGWRRAHKHTDTPGEEAIVGQIVQGVLNEICEYFDFDGEDRSA